MNQVAKIEETEVVAHSADAGVESRILDLIEKVAINPDVPVDKMRAILEMRREEEDRHRRTLFFDAMAMCQAELRPVVKNRENTQTNSKYADLEAISKACDPIIAKYGFSQSFKTIPGAPENHVRGVFSLTHSGHTEDYQDDMPLDNVGIKGMVNKTGPHARASSRTYLHRILKLGAFNIAVQNDDDGNAAGAPASITEDQYRQIRAKIETAGANEVALCKHFKVDALVDLRQDGFGYALALLDQKIAKAQADA